MRLRSQGLIIVKPARIVGQDLRAPFIVIGVMRGPSSTVLIIAPSAHSTVQCLEQIQHLFLCFGRKNTRSECR